MEGDITPRFVIWHCPFCEYYDSPHLRCPEHGTKLERIDITDYIMELTRAYSPEYLENRRNWLADFYMNYSKYLEAGVIDKAKLPKSTVRTLISIYDTALWTVKVRWWRQR